MTYTQETVNLLCDQLQKGFTSVVEVMFTTLSDRVKVLERENIELRIALEYAQKDIDILKVEKCSKEELAEVKLDLNDLELDVSDKYEKCTDRSDELENYTRIENILIDGIKEDEGWENEEVKSTKNAQGQDKFGKCED